LNICCAEYFVVAEPGKFWMWYSIIVPILLATRWKHFKANKMQYFLLDFCYMVNLLTFAHLYLLSHTSYSEQVFRVAFILTTGPLPAAVPVWMNSLVFHDVDRTVSVYIHTLPMCLYYTLKTSDPTAHGTAPLNLTDYSYALLFYLLWQAFYWLQTEVLDKDKLEQEALLTSLKWLSSNTRNALSGGCLRLCRKVALFGQEETFRPQEAKTKLVFVTSQLLFTILAMLPTYWCWQSPAVNICYICAIFTTAVYFGASYYVDVFSKKYALALEKAAERAVARAASRGGGGAAAAAAAAMAVTGFASEVKSAAGTQEGKQKGTSRDGPAQESSGSASASASEGDETAVDDYAYSDEIDSSIDALLAIDS